MLCNKYSAQDNVLAIEFLSLVAAANTKARCTIAVSTGLYNNSFLCYKFLSIVHNCTSPRLNGMVTHEEVN